MFTFILTFKFTKEFLEVGGRPSCSYPPPKKQNWKRKGNFPVGFLKYYYCGTLWISVHCNGMYSEFPFSP